MNEPPPLPDTSGFDWDSVESSEECPDRFALEVFASTLAWLITFCLSRRRGNPSENENARNKNKDIKTLTGRTNLKTGYRRFIALVYVYRPDLLDGRTVRAISEELNVSRQEINKFITDLSMEFGQQGIHQHKKSSRAIFRAAQLRKKSEQNLNRKMNFPDQKKKK